LGPKPSTPLPRSSRADRDLESDRKLGEQIRAARLSLEKTLQEVAQKTGVTRSFLSQVERGVANPSLTTLRRIAWELGVPVFLLLADEARDRNAVVRKDKRQTLILPNSSIAYQLLSPDLNRKIEMIITTLKAGGASCDQPLSHPGEECGFLLRGCVRVYVGEETFDLNEGDTIYFDATLPHRIVNVGAEKAEILSAITPPNF
jgi:transcriptional regulator with XRE-family HTH domain